MGNTVSDMEGMCTADENRKTVEMRRNDTAEDASTDVDTDLWVDTHMEKEVGGC